MAVPERISYDQLKEVYRRIGLTPQANEPYTFERADGFMVFHIPYTGRDNSKEFYWSQVVEDIQNAEELQGFESSVAEQFKVALFEMFADSNEN